MDNGQYRRTEHHLVLLFDELDRVSELFDLGAKSINFDLKGLKTLSKDKSHPTNGITLCTHTFVKVDMKDITAHNPFEVQNIVGSLAEHGATTGYIKRLLVEWDDGRIDQWKRRVIPGLAEYVSRSSGIIRNNVLTIVRPTQAELVPLGERYNELASPTHCPVGYAEGKEIRSCAGLEKMW